MGRWIYHMGLIRTIALGLLALFAHSQMAYAEDFPLINPHQIVTTTFNCMSSDHFGQKNDFAKRRFSVLT